VTCKVSVCDAPEVTMKHEQPSTHGKNTASSKSSDARNRQYRILALIEVGRREGLSANNEGEKRINVR